LDVLLSLADYVTKRKLLETIPSIPSILSSSPFDPRDEKDFISPVEG
jgi:hypothetical protein